MPPERQKRVIGESLYPVILEMHGQRAGKITGMLLEMEISELIHLLEDHSALQERAREALEVLQRYEQQQLQQMQQQVQPQQA
jgi:polyadenylate-binding protein